MSFVDKAKDAAQQAMSQAQQGLAQGQSKIDEVQSKRQLDGLYKDLGAAYYAEQRSGASHDTVTAALGAVDRWHHEQAHGDGGAVE
ncbi:MAG: hypothetical protein ACRDQA_21595 [Nocardioidaceae bacterium]